MSMYLYDNRLKSFTSKRKKWPYKESDGYKATPEELSLAGFYFNPSIASPDNVICFLCHKSMEGWDPNDDPFKEHFDHSPDCAWIICQCIKRNFNDNEVPFDWDDKDQLPTSKKMEEIRLKTFDNWWPHEGKKGWVGTSKKMSKAGFYYSPTYESIDNVICMYCEVGLEGWEPKDDPMKEHRDRFPSCPFFAKPPPKSKGKEASTANKKSRRKPKSTIQDGMEVIDLTNGNVKINRKGKKLKNININEEKMKLNEVEQVNNVNIYEEIDDQISNKTNDEGIGPTNYININEDEDWIDKQVNTVNISGENIEEEIGEPPNNISLNEKGMDEQVNNNKTNGEEINYNFQTEEIFEQLDDVQEDIVKLTNNVETNKDVTVEQVKNVWPIDNKQTKPHEEVVEEKLNISEIDEQPYNISENEEENNIIVMNEEGSNNVVIIDEEEQNNVVIVDEELNDIIINKENNSIIINDEEPYNSIINDEGQNNIINDEEQNSIINDEGQGNIINDEGQGNIINDEGQNNIINDEGQNNIIIGEGQNNIINDEGQNNIINDEGQNNIINDEGQNNIINNEESNDIITDERSNNNIINDEESNNNIININDEKPNDDVIMDEDEPNDITIESNNINIDESEPNNIITDRNVQIDNVSKWWIDEQVNHVRQTEEFDKVNDIEINEEINENQNISMNEVEQLNNFSGNEEVEQLNNISSINEEKIIDIQVENVKTKEEDKVLNESLETFPSDTKSEKDEVAKGNDIGSISSTIQVTMNGNNLSKDSNENPRTPVISKRLTELQSMPYIPHTPVSFIPKQYISTEPNRNIVNEVTPPAFITPTAFVKPKRRLAAFTVEDYLKSLTETQHMKFIEKTNQKIETLVELKKKAKEIISSIPII